MLPPGPYRLCADSSIERRVSTNGDTARWELFAIVATVAVPHAREILSLISDAAERQNDTIPFAPHDAGVVL